MKERVKTISTTTILLVLLSIAAVTALAAPVGPDTLTEGAPERRSTTSSGKVVLAMAGNITGLNINHTTITEAWQGYYGNVSGQIVLDDADNNSMYDWVYASPSGEVLATRNSGTVTWGSINCTNITNIVTEESSLNIGVTDVDGINETFNDASHPQFTIGSVTFSSDLCDYTTNTYTSDAPGSDFDEILLWENGFMIYTTLIEDGATGFDGNSNDFQIIVGEDGHNGDTSATNYYFYVELS